MTVITQGKSQIAEFEEEFGILSQVLLESEFLGKNSIGYQLRARSPKSGRFYLLSVVSSLDSDVYLQNEKFLADTLRQNSIHFIQVEKIYKI